MDITSSDLIKMIEDRRESRVNFLIIDVREYHEYEDRRIDGVDELMPLSRFQDWAEDFFNTNIDKKIIFTCRSGNRSGQVTQIFRQNGHENVSNHIGGIISYGGKTARGAI